MAGPGATLKQIVQYDIEYAFLSRGRQIRIASLTTDQVHLFGSAVAVSVTDKLRDFSPEHYVLANVGVSHSSSRCRPKQLLISRVIFRDKDQIDPAHFNYEFDGLRLDFKQIQ